MAKKKSKKHHQHEKHDASEEAPEQKSEWDEQYAKMEHEYEEQMKRLARIRAKIILKGGVLLAIDNDSKSLLAESFYGKKSAEGLELDPTEALYLMNVRNIPCEFDGKQLSFMELMEIFSKEPRIFARYNILRDWRDRGLNINFPRRMNLEDFGRSPVVKYPSKKTELPEGRAELLYFSEDMISITNYSAELKAFFEDLWFGQVGMYKQQHRDKIMKLDFIETLFLAKRGFCVRDARTGEQMKAEAIMMLAKERRPDAEALYDVYEDWRNRGYVLKTGFKFGTHFRLYFPGASPVKEKHEWLHSKHVIHVFPKEAKMIMSEWARAVRVAHSVRKTFIMAIPGMTDADYIKDKELIDFIGYHRKKQGIEKPSEDKPKFAVVAFTEDEEFGGREMATALDEADKLGLRLIIAITDRETAVTYYVAKRIELPGSRNRYYEIEWDQP